MSAGIRPPFGLSPPADKHTGDAPNDLTDVEELLLSPHLDTFKLPTLVASGATLTRSEYYRFRFDEEPP